MNKIKNNNSLVMGNASLFLIALGVSLGISLLLIAVFAFIMTVVDVPQFAIEMFGVMSLSVGTLISSILLGYKIKKGGLLIGIINGLMTLVLVTIIGFIINGIAVDLMILVKLISVLLSSMAGGIYAVNKVAKRRI